MDGRGTPLNADMPGLQPALFFTAAISRDSFKRDTLATYSGGIQAILPGECATSRSPGGARAPSAPVRRSHTVRPPGSIAFSLRAGAQVVLDVMDEHVGSTQLSQQVLINTCVSDAPNAKLATLARLLVRSAASSVPWPAGADVSFVCLCVTLVRLEAHDDPRGTTFACRPGQGRCGHGLLFYKLRSPPR